MLVDELQVLRASALQLAEAATGRPESIAASRLAERLGAGEFLICFVGEFKRGKSTLINALVGEEVLPIGALPLTAVATELRHGPRRALVWFGDQRSSEIDLADIAEYVTEERNPENALGVERVEVCGDWPMLAPGAVFVDTPGIASVHQHNTDAAIAAMADADGAVLVLSVDSPLASDERDLLDVLAQRKAPTFVVLNKADHLEGGDLDQVRRFVTEKVAEQLGQNTEVFALSARNALRGGLHSGPHDSGAFDAFASRLDRFIRDDLLTARLDTARGELSRLALACQEAVMVERAALELDAVVLDRRLQLFREAAVEQRAAFDDDRTLLRRDVDALGKELGERLRAFAADAATRQLASLDAVVDQAPRQRLVEELRQATESAVRDAFEDERARQARWLDERWRALAERFRTRTRRSLDVITDAAAGLFQVPVQSPTLPTVAEEPERFFYLFIYVGAHEDPVVAALGRLVPDRIARRRALKEARAEMVGEFDKHAGRARWDMAQRLEASRQRFEGLIREQLDAAIGAIGDAAERARELHTATDEDRRAHQDNSAHLVGVCAAIASGTRGTP